jgi:signal peptidase I
VIFDFSAIMVLLVAVSGAIWAVDAMFFAPKRYAAIAGVPGATNTDAKAAADRIPPPVLVDYARSFFPIFLIVLILRSFIVEPFRIPSGSMIPTLLVGDFILVNKYSYGIRLPLINKKVIDIGSPERGDVAVFRYPLDPSTPFIKRVVGIPGDKIDFRDRRLYINDKEVDYDQIGTYVGIKSSAQHTGAKIAEEDLFGYSHQILLTPRAHNPSFTGIVPPGSYFVLGDNRDNSRDSRYWGYVPDANLVGRAFMIWMNWDHGPELGRIGSKIR